MAVAVGSGAGDQRVGGRVQASAGRAVCSDEGRATAGALQVGGNTPEGDLDPPVARTAFRGVVLLGVAADAATIDLHLRASQVRVACPQVLRDRSSALAGQQVVGSRRSDVVGAAPDVDAPDAVARGRGIDQGTGSGREHRAPERKAHDYLGHQRFARVLGPNRVSLRRGQRCMGYGDHQGLAGAQRLCDDRTRAWGGVSSRVSRCWTRRMDGQRLRRDDGARRRRARGEPSLTAVVQLGDRQASCGARQSGGRLSGLWPRREGASSRCAARRRGANGRHREHRHGQKPKRSSRHGATLAARRMGAGRAACTGGCEVAATGRAAAPLAEGSRR